MAISGQLRHPRNYQHSRIYKELTLFERTVDRMIARIWWNDARVQLAIYSTSGQAQYLSTQHASRFQALRMMVQSDPAPSPLPTRSSKKRNQITTISSVLFSLSSSSGG